MRGIERSCRGDLSLARLPALIGSSSRYPADLTQPRRSSYAAIPSLHILFQSRRESCRKRTRNVLYNGNGLYVLIALISGCPVSYLNGCYILFDIYIIEATLVACGSFSVYLYRVTISCTSKDGRLGQDLTTMDASHGTSNSAFG